MDFLVIVLVSILFRGKQVEYNKSFKEEIINSLLNNFFSGVKYSPLSGMSSSIYKECKYYERYDIYKSDDYFEALINEKQTIQMADILTEEERTYTDSDGNTHTETTTLFSGLFAKINLGKSINNNLRITTNYLTWNKDKLKMDSAEFEKYFDVFSENKIIGMQLLTHDVMEILVQLRKLLNKRFDIYIYNDIMYLRFHVGPMFEGKISKQSPVDKEIVKRYYGILDYVCALSKEMIKTIEETEI